MSLRADIKALYTEGYKANFEMVKQLKPKRFEVFSKATATKGDGNKETQIILPGRLEERTNEFDNFNFTSTVQGYTLQVKYREFYKGLVLSRLAEEDTIQLQGLMKKLVSECTKKDDQTQESFAASVFNKGGVVAGDSVFNASFTDNTWAPGNLPYDSVCLFNLTGNPRKIYSQINSTGTYYNAFAGSLTLANLDIAYDLATKTNAVDERGDEVDNEVDTLLTETGTDSRTAIKLLSSELEPGSQKNDINAYKFLDVLKPMSWRHLSDSGAAYVGKAKSEKFQFVTRETPQITYFVDNRNGSHCATYINRYGVWIKDWRVWVKIGGTLA